MKWYCCTEQYSFTFLTLVPGLARSIPPSRKKGSTNHVSSSGVTALNKAAVDIWIKRRACLKRCTSPKNFITFTSSTQLLSTKARDREKKTSLSDDFLWVKQGGSRHQPAGQHSRLWLTAQHNNFGLRRKETHSQSFSFTHFGCFVYDVHSPCGPRQNCGLSSEVEMTYIRWKRSFLKGFLSCPIGSYKETQARLNFSRNITKW